MGMVGESGNRMTSWVAFVVVCQKGRYLRLVFFRWYLMVYTVTVLDLYNSKCFCMTTVLISFGTIETLNELSS